MSVGKIILKSTTRMSLNDRFTVLRQEKPTGQGQGQAQGSVGIEERRQQTQASRRNQRLAAQMERRPAVVAALKLKKKPQQRNEGFTQKRVLHDQINQRSNVKQRLAVKGRLSLPNNDVRRLTNNRGRAGVRGLRGSTGSFRGMNQRGFGFRGSRGFINNKGGGNISRVVGNGPKGVPTGMRTGMRGSYGGRFTRGVGVSRGGMQGRGGYRGGVHGAGMTGWQTRGLRRTRGLGRGGWINRGGRRGRGGMDIQNGGNFTREQLDEQLDEYMSKTTKSDEYDQHMTDLSM